jgi:hypothetical protein
VSGHGLALATVVIEQDAAYWEIHVEIVPASEGEGSKLNGVMFGVATKKDRKFYQALEEAADEGKRKKGEVCIYISSSIEIHSLSCRKSGYTRDEWDSVNEQTIGIEWRCDWCSRTTVGFAHGAVFGQWRIAPRGVH